KSERSEASSASALSLASGARILTDEDFARLRELKMRKAVDGRKKPLDDSSRCAELCYYYYEDLCTSPYLISAQRKRQPRRPRQREQYPWPTQEGQIWDFLRLHTDAY